MSHRFAGSLWADALIREISASDWSYYKKFNTTYGHMNFEFLLCIDESYCE